MLKQFPSLRKPRRRLPRALRGQSIVEYGLTIVLIFMLAQGTTRTVYQSFVRVITSVRSAINTDDDLTPTNGPSPTVRLPPPAPTFTALPATATTVATCPVPNVLGLPYTSAVTVWEQHGFASGSLTKTGSWSNGAVVGSQSLTQGTWVNCDGTSMNVTPGAAPTNTATATVAAAAQTATAVANRTATAAVNQTATASVVAQTATAGVIQTATASVVAQTATAAANQTATAAANQTATAAAIQTATAAAIQTATASAVGLPLVVNLTGVPANNGTYDEDSSALRIGATAYDPNIGTANGTGIARVEFVITGVDSGGTQRYNRTHSESSPAYCAFGGDSPCSAWSNWSSVGRYTYTVTATAYSSNGRPSVSRSVTFTIVK